MPKKKLYLDWFHPYYGKNWNDVPMPFLDCVQVPNERSPSSFSLLPKEQKLITLDELAIFLRVEPKTIYNWICAKQIECIKVGKFVRFTRSQVDFFLKANISEAIE